MMAFKLLVRYYFMTFLEPPVRSFIEVANVPLHSLHRL